MKGDNNIYLSVLKELKTKTDMRWRQLFQRVLASVEGVNRED